MPFLFAFFSVHLFGGLLSFRICILAADACGYAKGASEEGLAGGEKCRAQVQRPRVYKNAL